MVYRSYLELSHGLFGKLFDKGRFDEINKIYQKLSSTFIDRFYLEIQRHGDQNEISFEKYNLKQSSEIKNSNYSHQ